MKKKAAIVFGITQDYTFALANVLIGMKKHCKKFWDDIIVYHDGLSKRNMENLSKIFPCDFIVFDTSRFSSEANRTSISEYSFLAMARFECFDLLKHYVYVIWHDVDILIQGDFHNLLDAAEETGFALTEDARFFVEMNFYSPIQNYDLLRPLHNSGIMVLKDNLKEYATMSAYCYSKFNEYANKIRYLDQAVLNLLIQDYHLSVGMIDLKKYCCHPSVTNYQDAVIVHAYGKDKFWNSEELKIQFPEWVYNNNEWRRITEGGDVSKKPIVYENIPENPRISVVMSVYNRTEFLDESIKSILNQTYDNFEFLIILEKSQEQLGIEKQIREQYTDKRIRLICNETKLGFAASLNIGLEEARGEYIARMDDDDISLPQRFEKEIAFLDAHPDVAVVGTSIKMFMNSHEECIVPTTNEELRIRALNETPLYHPTVMMRKNEMEKYHLRYDENVMTEDYDLWCRALHFVKIANLPEILLLYRASGQNATVTQAEKVLNSHVKIVQRNFKEYLGIDLSYDEVILLERPEIVNNCYNMLPLSALRDEVLEKIIQANKKKKVFNQELLAKRFVTYRPGFTMRMTKRLQKYPAVLKLAKLFYGMISTKGEYSYLFHHRVKKLN